MAFPRQLLNDNEDIVLDLRPHWLFMALSTGVFVGVLILGGIIAATQLDWSWAESGLNWLGLIAFLAALVWVVLTYLRWINTHFVLTTDRIINRKGIVRKRGVDIPLDRVNTVIFHQGLLERMLGAGDLIIESASETGANNFKNVRKPNIVQKEIHVQMEANENRKFDRIRGAGPVASDATTPREPSIPEQIDQLSELHQRGVLSDAEFARKKNELLDRM